MVEFYDPLVNTNITYHIDSKLKLKWDKHRDGLLAKANEDRVYIVDGRERTGKSSFAFQQAKYINPNFTIDDICFDPKDFLDRIRNAPKGSVIVFDEAFKGLSSKSSRSKVNKAIVEALMEVGQRNLIIFIVLPTIFLLEIYAAVFRTECLFHVYKLKSGGRAFKIYNYNKKKKLYLYGRQHYFSYSQPKIYKAKGRFFVNKEHRDDQGKPYSTFDLDAYLKKKEENFRNIEKKEEKEENKYMIQRDFIIKGLYEDFIHSQRKLSAWLEEKKVGLAKSQIGIILGKTAENEEMPTGHSP